MGIRMAHNRLHKNFEGKCPNFRTYEQRAYGKGSLQEGKATLNLVANAPLGLDGSLFVDLALLI